MATALSCEDVTPLQLLTSADASHEFRSELNCLCAPLKVERGSGSAHEQFVDDLDSQIWPDWNSYIGMAPQMPDSDPVLCWQDESSLSECSSTDWVYSDASVKDEATAQGVRRQMSCNSCHDSFQNLYSLEQHAKLSGHRTFVCPILGCSRSYCRRDLWARHRRTHELEHLCIICQEMDQLKSFKRKDHLRQHIRSCHPNCHPESVLNSIKASRSGLSRQVATKQPRTKCSQGLPEQTKSKVVTAMGRTPEDVEYESPTVRDIVKEIKLMHGGHTDVLRALEESLDLNEASTTEQLARKLAQLAVKSPAVLARSGSSPANSGLAES